MYAGVRWVRGCGYQDCGIDDVMYRDMRATVTTMWVMCQSVCVCGQGCAMMTVRAVRDVCAGPRVRRGCGCMRCLRASCGCQCDGARRVPGDGARYASLMGLR